MTTQSICRVSHLYIVRYLVLVLNTQKLLTIYLKSGHNGMRPESLLYVYVVLEYWDLMNADEKHDKIPEIWEGHNIADYIDPEIMKVRNTNSNIV